jgi:superfamily I DNA/RNA helicase
MCGFHLIRRQSSGVYVDLLQAKGLEWDTVFICRVNEGTIPMEFKTGRRNQPRDANPDDAARKHYEVGSCSVPFAFFMLIY